MVRVRDIRDEGPSFGAMKCRRGTGLLPGCRASSAHFSRLGGFNEVEQDVDAGAVPGGGGRHRRASSAAQDFRGRINGTVTDNTGAILPGVTVTATSPALIQPQVQVTGADGDFRFLALPPGVYDVTFELSGFQTRQARRHSRRHQSDADRRSAAAGGDAAGNRHGDRRLADRRHVDHAGRHQLHQGAAHRDSERARHLGGDGAGARTADERRTTSAARAPARRPASSPTASAIRARPSSKASTRPKAPTPTPATSTSAASKSSRSAAPAAAPTASAAAPT